MQQDLYTSRKFVVQGVFIIAVLMLLFKCFQIQVIDESYQQQHSYRQAITLYPSRGLIYDRNGKLMIYNRAMYDLMATYKQIQENEIDTMRFCQLLGIDKATFIANLDKDFKHDPQYSRHKPFEFLTRITADSFSKFEEHLYEFSGFDGVRKNVRGYSVSSTAHILGYISEVNQKQIDKYEGLYRQGDYIGASGLEYFYEEQLRGVRGVRHVLKDNLGRIQGQYKDGDKDEPAESGYNLISSIDLDLQEYGEYLMQNKKGAIVAIEPSSGEILSMVSAPYYDPSLLAVDSDRQKAYTGLLQDSLEPLFNRALMAQYPPGSIFKTIMSAIGLQEGVLTPERGITCGGAYRYGTLRLACHGHPSTVTVPTAIQFSCNAFYCQVYRELVSLYGFDYPDKGLDRLVEHWKAFGLGEKLGVDLPNEASGHIPTTAFYDERYGEGRWRFSHSVSVGIGQGEIQITPLQMANLTAIIANRGYYIIPHFAKEFEGDNSGVLDKYQEKHYTKVHPNHFVPVVEGMERVVKAGTGRRAQIPGISVCGKTGTVENPHGKDHSTFIAFAPKDDPQIAIAVYVENGGFGSTYAAPIASLMIEKYMRGEIVTPQRQYLENSIAETDLIGKKKVQVTGNNEDQNQEEQ